YERPAKLHPQSRPTRSDNDSRVFPADTEAQLCLRETDAALEIDALLLAQGGGEFRRAAAGGVFNHHCSHIGMPVLGHFLEAHELACRLLFEPFPPVALVIRKNLRRPAGNDFELQQSIRADTAIEVEEGGPIDHAIAQRDP